MVNLDRVVHHLKLAELEIHNAQACFSCNLTDDQMKYLSNFGIHLGIPYILKGKFVIPFASNNDEKNTGAALDLGFIHFKHSDGNVFFCGVGYFKDNAKRFQGTGTDNDKHGKNW